MRHFDLWDDWQNAEIYREYVERFPIYPELNRRLADLADLGTARRVLDLACGSGATAVACLEKMAPDAELVGVDGAPAMVEVARSQVGDPRARFVAAHAQGLVSAVGGRFDRVVCNAAFWMFPRRRRLVADLAALLEPGGLLVFDVPSQIVAGEGSAPDPFQVALARSLDREVAEPIADLPELEVPALQALFRRCGIPIRRIERFRHRARLEELIELMRIPAMAGRVAPDLSPARRQELVDRAASQADGTAEVEVVWLFFLAGPEVADGERNGPGDLR